MLLGILALALVLRMGWPALTEFKRDEATVVRRGLAIAYEGDLPATGVDSSRGMANLPLTLYLTALPLRLWQDPLAVALFTGLLNGLAVLACYAVGRAYFGQRVGLMAAFLFAVSPWAIVYGRKMWSQNLPLVTLGFFAALCATFSHTPTLPHSHVRSKRWALVGAWVGLAALIGLHLGGLAFIPVLAIPMVLYRKQVARWPLLVGVALFALAVSPYVIYDARHGWPNLRAFAQYAGGEAHWSGDALRYAFFLTGSAGIQGMAGGLYPQYLAGLPDLWWLNWVMMGLLALALLYAVVQVVRGPAERRRLVFLLLLWFAVPIALQSRPTAPVHPFYFILLYPAQFFLIAILLVDCCSSLPQVARSGVCSLFIAPLFIFLLVWGAWQVAVVGRLLVFAERRPTTGGYGIPLKYTRAAALQARRLAGPAEIVVLSAGTDPATDETPAVFEALLFGHPHRFADGRWAAPVPDAPQAVYVVGPVQDNPADFGQVLERLEAMEYVRPGPLVALPDGWYYRLFYRDGAGREDVMLGLERFPEALRFANGTVFLGCWVPGTAQEGGTLEVWLAWWVSVPPPPGMSYHFFTHLLDESGALRSQHDGAGFPTVAWRAGDLVLSRFSIPVPENLAMGRYQVWAGLYSYPDVAGVSFLDAAGNPAGERVMLGEVEVGR